jgi:hypothetical protein
MQNKMCRYEILQELKLTQTPGKIEYGRGQWLSKNDVIIYTDVVVKLVNKIQNGPVLVLLLQSIFCKSSCRCHESWLTGQPLVQTKRTNLTHSEHLFERHEKQNFGDCLL